MNVHFEDRIDAFKKAVEFLEEEGYEASVREDYSGRGMYGQTIPAIVSDAPATLVGATVYAAATELWHEPDVALKMVPRLVDGMGLGKVFY